MTTEALKEQALVLRREGASVREIAAALEGMVSKSTVAEWTKGEAPPKRKRRASRWASGRRPDDECPTVQLSGRTEQVSGKVSRAPRGGGRSGSAVAVSIEKLREGWDREKTRLAAHPAIADPDRLPNRLRLLIDRTVGYLDMAIETASARDLAGVLKIATEMHQVLTGRPTSIEGHQDLPADPQALRAELVGKLASPGVLRVIEGGKGEGKAAGDRASGGGKGEGKAG